MSRVVACIAVILIAVAAAPAGAKIPPLSKAELWRRANVVVEGKVVRVVPVGKRYSDSCYHWQKHRATFHVSKRSKGKTTKTISIVFATRGGDVNPRRPCDGGRTSYSLSKGVRYRLHLVRKRRGKKLVYAMFNWAGVRRLP